VCLGQRVRVVPGLQQLRRGERRRAVLGRLLHRRAPGALPPPPLPPPLSLPPTPTPTPPLSLSPSLFLFCVCVFPGAFLRRGTTGFRAPAGPHACATRPGPRAPAAAAAAWPWLADDSGRVGRGQLPPWTREHHCGVGRGQLPPWTREHHCGVGRGQLPPWTREHHCG
jgi:hypothetical protein